MQKQFFGDTDEMMQGAGMDVFKTRLTACPICQAGLQGSFRGDLPRTFWFVTSATLPIRHTLPATTLQNGSYRLSRLLHRLWKPARR